MAEIMEPDLPDSGSIEELEESRADPVFDGTAFYVPTILRGVLLQFPERQHTRRRIQGRLHDGLSSFGFVL